MHYSKKKVLSLETAAGHPIDNIQETEISQYDVKKSSSITARVKSTAEIRTLPSPRYNCHGLVFASRRTNIDNVQNVFQILLQDDYELITDLTLLRPGDIAIYHSESGEPEHSAIVVSIPTSKPIAPIVVSKWGCGEEVIHSIYDCPYALSDIRYYRISKP